MFHRRATLLLAVLALLLVAAPAWAEEEKEDKIPPLASEEAADEALDVFKDAWRARGMRGDQKTAARAWALEQLAEVQHPRIVDKLARIARSRDPDLRTAALLQLGKQRRLPAYAGRAVLEAMERHDDDDTFTMSGLSSIGRLRYLGAKDKLLELLKHHEYAVVKNALVTIGKMDDARTIEDIVKLMKKLKIDKGASWDGVNVTYDTGTAGDHDQKMAEKIGKAAEAKNKRKGKRATKSMRDLGPVVLEVMYQLTGQQFSGSIAAREWIDENRKQIDERIEASEKAAEAQDEHAKQMKKLR